MAEKEEIEQLQKNSPRKIFDAEVREIWEEQNPKGDYDKFDQKTQNWSQETTDYLVDFSNRWNVERSKMPVLEAVDQKIKSSLAPVNQQAKATYDGLLERFNDYEISQFSNKWVMPKEADPAWRELLKSTDQQVQRNASKLAAVVTTVTIVAGDEVGRKAKNDAIDKGGKAKGFDPDTESANAKTAWQASDLYKALDSLEEALTKWDKLLAEQALPDANQLQGLADNCNASFKQFYRAHLPVYDAADAVPFVKYQLLATMRSLSEKIASQFAARLGNPSFSAAYSLIRDVPLSGTYQQSQEQMTKLQGYQQNYKKGFSDERDAFMKKIKTSSKAEDPNAYKTLEDGFREINGGFDASLEAWGKAYADVGSGDPKTVNQAVKQLYESTAQLAVGFRNYQQAVDDVLKKFQSTNVGDERKAYQSTLDGFLVVITRGIEIGTRLLQ